jgi:hypothetical protein
MPSTRANVTASFGSAPSANNPVINGAFDIWQRGTSTSTSQAFAADRWQVYLGSGTGTWSRQSVGDSTNLPNIQYCMRVQRNSGQTTTSVLYAWQNMETVQSIPLAGKTVTFSFYARKGADFSSSGSALSVTVRAGTGTDQNAWLTGYTGQTDALSLTATLTTTWQRFSVTATLAGTITELAPAFFYTPTGTAGTNDYYEVTGVQIDVGSVALPFRRSGGTIASELAACQRYFQRYGTGVSSLYVFGNLTKFSDGSYYGGTAAEMGLIYPVQFRTSPTLSTTGTWKCWTGHNHNATGTISVQVGTTSNAMLRFEKSSSTWTGDYAYIASEDGGYVNFSAEI